MVLFEGWASNATRLRLATLFLSFMARVPGYRRDGQKEVQKQRSGMKRNPSLVVASQRVHCSPPVWTQHLFLRPSTAALCLDIAHYHNLSTESRIQELLLFLLLRHQQPYWHISSSPPCTEPFLSALAHCQYTIYLHNLTSLQQAVENRTVGHGSLAPLNGATRGCRIRRVCIQRGHLDPFFFRGSSGEFALNVDSVDFAAE